MTRLLLNGVIPSLTDNPLPAASGTGQTRTDLIASTASAAMPALYRITRYADRSPAVTNDAGRGISEGDTPFADAAAPGAIDLRVVI